MSSGGDGGGFFSTALAVGGGIVGGIATGGSFAGIAAGASIGSSIGTLLTPRPRSPRVPDATRPGDVTTETDEPEVTEQEIAARRRQRLPQTGPDAPGRGGTILTSPQGTIGNPGNTNAKTLLGR